MLPNARGIVATDDGAEVVFDLTGRTVFVDRDGEEVGRQLLLVLLESEDGRYAWLNNAVCVGEGVISAETLTMHMDVFQCIGESDRAVSPRLRDAPDRFGAARSRGWRPAPPTGRHTSCRSSSRWWATRCGPPSTPSRSRPPRCSG